MLVIFALLMWFEHAWASTGTMVRSSFAKLETRTINSVDCGVMVCDRRGPNPYMRIKIGENERLSREAAEPRHATGSTSMDRTGGWAACYACGLAAERLNLYEQDLRLSRFSCFTAMVTMSGFAAERLGRKYDGEQHSERTFTDARQGCSCRGGLAKPTRGKLHMQATRRGRPGEHRTQLGA